MIQSQVINNSGSGNGFFKSSTTSTVLDRFTPPTNRVIDPMKESTMNYVRQFSRGFTMENLPENRLKYIS